MSGSAYSLQPWAVPQDKTLVLDLKGTVYSLRNNRQVVSAKLTAKAQSQISESNLTLGGVCPLSLTVTLPVDNQMLVLTASSPVRITLTRSTGSIDLGLNAALVVSSPSLSVLIEAQDASVKVEVHLLHL